MKSDKNKKCSFKEHKNIDAVSYCQDCKIYICNKCLSYHKGFFDSHIILDLDNKIENFIDICEEKTHQKKLEFYCNDHNILCCAACITKIEAKGYGQHKDCDVCIIEKIKEKKKIKLNENIKYLEDLSINLDNIINELKMLFNKVEQRKEEVKIKIKSIFTKIKTVINEREDELLLKIDNKYNDIFGNESLIKDLEAVPNKIKFNLEKGKMINNEWNDNNKLSLIIYNCIQIENNIKNIYSFNESIKKSILNYDVNIEFIVEKEYIVNLLKSIKSLGKLKENYALDSSILKNIDESNKFYILLSSQIKINKMKLLYRASKDGLGLEKLKNKINNKSNLIFLFLTGETRIFGSFIKTQIEVTHNKYIKDKDAFAFSLNKNKIYKILIPEYAMLFFDGNPIRIGNTSNNNGFWIYSGSIYGKELLKNPKVYDFQNNNELTEGKNNLIELEIFEVS